MKRSLRSYTICSLFAIIILIEGILCKRFGGGGFRGGGSRGGFRGRTGYRGSSYRLRNTGYGKNSGSRTIYPRTSLYSRNYGTYVSNRRSSSYNGFGLGLGAGMFLGYRTGWLFRPIGYGSSNYNYNYIHEHREYKMEKPFKCAFGNVTEFMKPNQNSQEINIKEGEIICPSDDDYECYGKLTITSANITDEEGDITEGFIVNIEKGCSRAGQFETLGLTRDADRKCFTSQVIESSGMIVTDGEASNDLLTLAKALKVGNNLTLEASTSIQFQACVCKGWYCNSGYSPEAIPIMLLVTHSILNIL